MKSRGSTGPPFVTVATACRKVPNGVLDPALGGAVAPGFLLPPRRAEGGRTLPVRAGSVTFRPIDGRGVGAVPGQGLLFELGWWP